MSGYDKMRRALANHVLSRPRGLWERLVFPLARTAYRQGFEAGYATGFIGADRKADADRAGVWDEGYTVGNKHNGRRDANPYRAQEAGR